jgi:hypothetical protein
MTRPRSAARVGLEDSGGISVGVIIAIVLGSLVFVAVIVLLATYTTHARSTRPRTT